MLGKVAAEVRTCHDRDLAAGISAKFGVPMATALRLATARHRGVLLPYMELEFDHLGTVLVANVLAEPERDVGETLADPLEGVAYGHAKAKVMKADDGGLLIHSFAHGRGSISSTDPRRQRLRSRKLRQTQQSNTPSQSWP